MCLCGIHCKGLKGLPSLQQPHGKKTVWKESKEYQLSKNPEIIYISTPIRKYI